ncbi:hypothetical protein Ahy_B02g058355 isoform F [Arachis hypogaea]|uniref:Uncharacterized protein n=1 Tax=Arachis hypogaea TaxID=3818 RepID=A0A445AEG3_ARAHY|nr:hypothetical protein Ahy_B02g058355 isoform F [Arachis hypogaea]
MWKGSRFNALYKEGEEDAKKSTVEGLKDQTNSGLQVIKAQTIIEKGHTYHKKSPSHKKGPIVKNGAAKNEKPIITKANNHGKQVANTLETLDASPPPKSHSKNPDMEALEMESSKVLEYHIVKTDLSTQRLGASFSSSGAMTEKAVNSQQDIPPYVHMMVSPVSKNKEGSSSRDRSGDWEVDKIKDWLPDDVVSKIAVIPPPSPWKDKDQIAWALTSDGCFKLKSAYQDLQNTTDISSNIFSLIKARYEEYLHVMNVHWRQKHNKPAAYPLAPSS